MVLGLTLLDSDTSLAAQSRSGISWRDSGHVAVMTSFSPRGHVLPWDGVNLGADNSFVGTSLDEGLAISHNGLYIAIANQIAKRIKVYNFTAGGFGSLIATSAAWTGGTSIFGIAWSPNDDVIVVSQSGGAFLVSFTFDGAALGAPVVPGTPPGFAAFASAGVEQAVAFSPDGLWLAAAEATGGTLLNVYPMAAGGVFGTPFAPAVAVNAGLGGTGVAWAPGSDFVALAVDNDPFCVVYSRGAGSLGSPITPTMVAPGFGVGYNVRFDRNGAALFVGGTGMDDNKKLYAYTFNGVALSGRADPDVDPGDAVAGLDISADNSVIATYDGGEDIDIYATGLPPPAPIIGEHFIVSNRTLRFQDGEIEVEAELVAQDWLDAIRRGL